MSEENNSFDVVIIGAGVIGAAVGFELSKRGYKTLNIDKNPAAGYGSTSSSCAIIRVHYSTIPGTALAYESYYDWKNWAGYLDAEDERGLAAFHETGCLVMKTKQNGYLENICANVTALDIPFEHWDAAKVVEAIPAYDMKKYWPAKRFDDENFAEPTGGEVEGAVMFPNAGYISDPQLSTHNLQRAAEAKGGKFLFNRAIVAIPQSNGRVTGVELDDGTMISAPVVVNVAGPHSAIINEMADALGDMNIKTKALRQEVVHVPAPPGMDFEDNGFVISDSDIACYCRPETGNHILVGSEDPDCDGHTFVDPDDFNRDFSDQWTTQAHRMAQRIPSLGIPSKMRGVVDLYDVSDDWIPIYDKSSVGGYYMAIGSSGNQFKNASQAGAIMAELIGYCEAGRDHDTDPMTFDLKRVGHKLDVSAFSRLREINQDSSFSVLG
ncbi:MAG: FAD-binding oxidoreductase [Rhizobiales bacterium]|nr:FAD-binding oxidoreductase [Hyphomicrobiales bacterium]